MSRVKLLVPLVFFLMLCVFLWRGLSLDPHELPSTLINKPLPAFTLPDVLHPSKNLTTQTLHGQISLLNVWATWCINCRLEHPILIDIAHYQHIPIYGIAYKDSRSAVDHWLTQYGNPYRAIGFDETGNVAINLGVYGTPETFVIDQQGVVRYKYIGPITTEVWQNDIQPEIKKLRSEN